jgi:hypothetical protein
MGSRRTQGCCNRGSETGGVAATYKVTLIRGPVCKEESDDGSIERLRCR